MNQEIQLKIKMEQAIARTDPNTEAGRKLSNTIESNCAKMPDLSLIWGEKLLANDDNRPEALKFIYSAVAKSEFDKRPVMILAGAAKLLMQKKLFEQAEAIYRTAIMKYPDDQNFRSKLATLYIDRDKPEDAIKVLERGRIRGPLDNACTIILAQAYIHLGAPQSAIDFLKPLQEAGNANMAVGLTLANAYLHDARPKHAARVLRSMLTHDPNNNIATAMLGTVMIHDKDPIGAIRLLGPLYNKGASDPVIVGTLAKACVYANDRNAFDQVKDQIPNRMYRDYLEAQMLHAEHKPVSALEKIRPYIQGGDISAVSKNMMTLYVSLLDEDHPILPMIKAALGDEKFTTVMESRNAWFRSPLIAELQNDRGRAFSSTLEVGGVPTKRTERIVAERPRFEIR